MNYHLQFPHGQRQENKTQRDGVDSTKTVTRSGRVEDPRGSGRERGGRGGDGSAFPLLLRGEREVQRIFQRVGTLRDHTAFGCSTPDLGAADGTSYLRNRHDLPKAGEHDTTLKALEDELAELRSQHQARPAEFEFKRALAVTLVYYSNTLHEAGRLAEAFCAIEEAIPIWRSMCKTWPKTVEENLAGALQVYSSQLHKAGREEEALNAAEESIPIYYTLHKAQPEAFEMQLHSVLLGYSTGLLQAGRFDDGLKATEQFIATYQTIRGSKTAADNESYAKTLMIYSHQLAEVYRFEDALKISDVSLAMSRTLHKDANVAKSLVARSAWLHALGRYDETMTITEESMKLLQDLSKANPEEFQPILAITLLAYSSLVFRARRLEEAVHANKQSSNLLVALNEAHPEKYLPFLEQARQQLELLDRAVGGLDVASAA